VPLAEEKIDIASHLSAHGAISLMHHGVDLTVIALWLGHESSETTQIYLHADMQLKERALAHATANGVAPKRYKPPDPLLAFVEAF
jgi:site-specific recombinase XerD